MRRCFHRVGVKCDCSTWTMVYQRPSLHLCVELRPRQLRVEYFAIARDSNSTKHRPQAGSCRTAQAHVVGHLVFALGEVDQDELGLHALLGEGGEDLAVPAPR